MKAAMKFFSIGVFVVISLAAINLAAADASVNTYQGNNSGLCIANSAWVSNPALPVPFEVANGKQASLCNFDQFSWQVFLTATKPIEIVQPSPEPPIKLAMAEFQTWMPTYGVFKGGKILKSPAKWGTPPDIPDNACGSSKQNPTFFSNLNDQAGSGHPLIDQSGNYTYYQVSMNKIMYDFATQCGLTTDKNDDTVCTKKINKVIPTAFPAGAIELKTAWRVLGENDNPSDYYTTVGTIKPPTEGASCQDDVTLGLVGFHLVTATKDHPEMLWATFEHINNAPYCQDSSDPQPAPYPAGKSAKWSFNNPACLSDDNGDHCNTNTYYPTPIPTQACIAFAQGGGIPTNITNVVSLNTSIQSFIPEGSVWKNYVMGGNIWTNNGSTPSVESNQRGSLSLSNSVMETYTQPPGDGFAVNNCFGCHSYTDTPTKVSHLPRTTNP